MTHCELILQGISDGDTMGGPVAMASLVASTLSKDPFDFDALDQAYLDYYESGCFDSGPTFEKVHELMAKGTTRKEAVLETHKLLNGSTAGCNPMHRFMVVAGLNVPYEHLDTLARKDGKMTHHDPIAGICSGFLIRVVRRCIDGDTPKLAYESVLRESSMRDQKLFDIEANNSGYAPAVLLSALEFTLNDKDGLLKSLQRAEPNNYCPPLVGVLTMFSGLGSSNGTVN